jgi:hypothetical protein
MGKGFEDDLQPDAVDVANGNADDGAVFFVGRQRGLFYNFGYFFHRWLLLLLLPGYVCGTNNVAIKRSLSARERQN